MRCPNPLGSQRFGTYYRFRDADTGQLDGDMLPVDLALNAESLGADVIRVNGITEFRKALDVARAATRTTVIHIDTDPLAPRAVLRVLVGRSGVRGVRAGQHPAGVSGATSSTRPPSVRSSPPSASKENQA